MFEQKETDGVFVCLCLCERKLVSAVFARLLCVHTKRKLDRVSGQKRKRRPRLRRPQHSSKLARCVTQLWTRMFASHKGRQTDRH